MKIRATLGITAFALALALGCTAPVMADLKMTSSVSVSMTGGQGNGRSHSGTFTVYYQGANLRVENGHGMVMIYNATTNTVYRLNTSDSTYSVMPSPPQPRGNPPAGSNNTFSLTSTGQTGAVSGVSTTAYTLSETAPAGPPPGGRGPGGPPPGGQDNGQGGAPPTATVTGTVTLTSSAVLGSGAKNALMMSMQPLLGLRGPLARPLVEKLVSLQEAPVAASLTITLPAAPDGTQPVVTIKSNATSISTASLDASLFAVPASYKQVAAPTGGPGGGGSEGGGGESSNARAHDEGPGGGGQDDGGPGGPGGPGDGGPGGGPGDGGPGGGGPGGGGPGGPGGGFGPPPPAD